MQRRKQHNHILRMNKSQVGILLLLGFLACGLFATTGFLFFNKSDNPIFTFNLSNSIVGKWEKYIEPTPTPTLGLTPTPHIEKDLFGNEHLVTPMPFTPPIKITCDFSYPPSIEFFRDETYVGISASMFSDIFVWQGGQYELLDSNRIKMQTKNGFAVYQLTYTDNNLTFTDDTDCIFSYTKSMK